MKKLVVILSLVVVAIVIIALIFGIAIYQTENINFDKDFEYRESVIGVNIANPDRIVYRNEKGKYFQFKSGEEKYDTIKALLGNSITSFNEKGEFLQDEQIDEIHEKCFIEFDYEKISKNYIIQLEENNNQAVIKLANSGGNVVSEKIQNVNKIKRTLNKLSENEKPYSLDYKEMLSRNSFNGLEYKYQELFKEINFGIYQVKITDMEQYEIFENICNLAFEEEITQEIFVDNNLILTVSAVPKIDVKVNLGNIRYTYNTIKNAGYQYTCHLLIVDKIVNIDCIYNTNLSQVESNIAYDNMKIEHDDSVDNLNENIFVIDYDTFIKEYKNSNSTISQAEAEKIVEKGFEEAERICGSYDKSSQTCKETSVKPNNFFTRKITQGDKMYDESVDVYQFTRVDDMDINGLTIYVDKKLGKIVGGGAFGD